jgi:hypothetical protein
LLSRSCRTLHRIPRDRRRFLNGLDAISDSGIKIDGPFFRENTHGSLLPREASNPTRSSGHRCSKMCSMIPLHCSAFRVAVAFQSSAGAALSAMPQPSKQSQALATLVGFNFSEAFTKFAHFIFLRPKQ